MRQFYDLSKRLFVFWGRLGTILVMLALGIGIGAGITVLADTTSTDPDLIHACMHDQTREIYLTDDTTTCAAGYTPVHWPERGITSVEIRENTQTVAALSGLTVAANCAPGPELVLGGGYTKTSALVTVEGTYPTGGGIQWAADFFNADPLFGHDVTVYAVCGVREP